MHTIAIPAYNAAGALDRLLASLDSRLPPSVSDVVVCDNGSTDGTAEVARRWSRRLPAVRVVAEPAPGKPAAWNRLVREAATDVVVFLDADVVPERGALARMVEAMEVGGHVACSGRRRYAGATPWSAWVAALADPVIELCLIGSCYAIHRGRLRERMASRGFGALPDVFAEDIVLQALLDPGDVVRLDDCVVEVPLESMDAYVLLLARRHLVRHELSTRVPDLGRRLDDLFPEALRPWPQLGAVLRGPYPLARKVRWAAGGLAKSALLLVYRRRIHAAARGLIAQYDEIGGGRVLRALASRSGPPEAAAAPAGALG